MVCNRKFYTGTDIRFTRWFWPGLFDSGWPGKNSYEKHLVQIRTYRI